MNKPEALEFLELPESASGQDIKTRMVEKLAYFELLSEKSPSAFLRRIHTQNVNKIKLLQKEILLWEADVAKISGLEESPGEPEVPVEESETALDLLPETAEENAGQTGSDDQQSVLPASELIVLPEAEKEQESTPLIEIVPEAESIAEAENVPEAKTIPEAESIAEPENVPEAKTVPEAESIAEPENVPERENVPEAKNIPEIEIVREPVNIQAIAATPEIEKVPAAEITPLPDAAAVPVEQAGILPIGSDDKDTPLAKEMVQPEVPDPAPQVEPEPVVQPFISGSGQSPADTTTFFSTVEWSKTRQRAAPEPVGWLVRHTENQPVKNFPLFPGKNFIGRKPQPGLKPFIQVEEDPFVSRVHAALYAEGAGPYSFYISDSSASNGGKASKNGTYVNGSEDRINTKVKLNNKDTVQIGVSKFVLRYKMANLNKMIKEVEDSAYMHTVVIEIHGQ